MESSLKDETSNFVLCHIFIDGVLVSNKKILNFLPPWHNMIDVQTEASIKRNEYWNWAT